jgi:hypothetical protein
MGSLERLAMREGAGGDNALRNAAEKATEPPTEVTGSPAVSKTYTMANNDFCEHHAIQEQSQLHAKYCGDGGCLNQA